MSKNTSSVDTYKDYAACDKDNTLAFGADGKVTFDEGATKCSASDPQISTGTWAFTGTEKKKVILTDSGFAITLDIVSLDASTLKWSYVDAFSNKTVIQTYSK